MSEPSIRQRAENLWEEIGGDLCICAGPDVPHWCEKCQGRISLIESQMAPLPADAEIKRLNVECQTLREENERLRRDRDSAVGLRRIADFLGVTSAKEIDIERRISEIVSERNRYQELERQQCDPDETLEQCIGRLTARAEAAFNAGYENGLGVAVQAIEHDKEERTAYHAWDGMNRAISAIKEVQAGTFVWKE